MNAVCLQIARAARTLNLASKPCEVGNENFVMDFSLFNVNVEEFL